MRTIWYIFKKWWKMWTWFAKAIWENNEKYGNVWKVIFEYLEKQFKDLEELVTYDNIQSCFAIIICFVVLLCKTSNVIVVVRSFLLLIVLYGRNTLLYAYDTAIRTKSIIRNTNRIIFSSCIMEVTVLNYWKSVSLCLL